jgi:hypothetical protein
MEKGAGVCGCRVASDFSLIASKPGRSDDRLEFHAALFFGEPKTRFEIALLGTLISDQESNLSLGVSVRARTSLRTNAKVSASERPSATSNHPRPMWPL